MLDDEPSTYTPCHAVCLLLESFVRMHHYVPDQAQAITNSDELPNKLRPLTETHQPLTAWRAWTDEPRLWFVIGRLSGEQYPTRDPVLLEMLFVDTDGRPVAAGCWGLSLQGHWILRRVYDPGGNEDDIALASIDSTIGNKALR